jgi:lipopolysaccharide/colanic/teichoic acid biosynthesis glycosyltransferase
VISSELRIRIARRGRVSPRYLVAKRAFDLAVCLWLLPIVLPLLLLCALAVRIDSPGRALIAQERTWKDGRRFRMLKFRTMVQNAEDLKAGLAHLNILPPPDFKIPNDPRITRVGKILRETSLDELPQLFNVLRGDMSLVGPRPCLQYETEYFAPHHFERFLVRPGLTGLWQVVARAHSTFGEALDMDVAYVRGWSLWLDVTLLCRTPIQLLRGGATA